MAGTNVSGTSDCAPLQQQAEMIMELIPDAKEIGILYCSAEPNSRYQTDIIKSSLEELGCSAEVKEYTFTGTDDIAAVTTTAAENCDVIYIPTDNTAASNAELSTRSVSRQVLSGHLRRKRMSVKDVELPH